MGKIRNPKLEIRNKPKSPKKKRQNPIPDGFEPSDLGF
jgi:hypothetical protein